MGTIKTTNIEPIADNGTVTLGGSGDTFTLGSGVTQTIAVNTPAFEAYLSSNQTFSDASYTKVNFNTEIYDTNSDYDNSSNYRFTPTVAGKYLVYSTLVMFAGGSTEARLAIYKNGSIYKQCDADYDNGTEATNVISTSTAIDFNGSSDYVEIYGYLDITSGTATFFGSANKPCSFGAFKIIQ